MEKHKHEFYFIVFIHLFFDRQEEKESQKQKGSQKDNPKTYTAGSQKACTEKKQGNQKIYHPRILELNKDKQISQKHTVQILTCMWKILTFECNTPLDTKTDLSKTQNLPPSMQVTVPPASSTICLKVEESRF